MKLTTRAISALHFNDVKVFVLDTYSNVVTARALLQRWKYRHPGCDFQSKAEMVDGKYLFYVTLFDHCVDKPRKKKQKNDK